MATATANDARIRWGELIDTVRTEPVHITKHGRPVAVLVDPAFFERAVIALEDLADLAAAEAARSDDGTPVTHEELARELGIEL